MTEHFNKTNLLKVMKSEATGAFGDGWEQVRDFAPAEFEKMAVQLVNIVKNVARFESSGGEKGYSKATAKALVRMQLNAMESVLAAVSALVLLTIERAVNAVMKAVKAAFSEVLGSIL
jgi:hypothetical protein